MLWSDDTKLDLFDQRHAAYVGERRERDTTQVHCPRVKHSGGEYYGEWEYYVTGMLQYVWN